MKRSETTTSYRPVVEASQRRPSSTPSCTSGRRGGREVGGGGPPGGGAPEGGEGGGGGGGGARARRRDQVGEDDVRDRGEENPRPETDRRQHDEARRDRAADRAQRVGGRELA